MFLAKSIVYIEGRDMGDNSKITNNNNNAGVPKLSQRY